MKRKLSELERLDLVARAQGTETVFSHARFAMILLSVFTVLLAIGSKASFYVTLAVRALAVSSIVGTITVWLRWRYNVLVREVLLAFVNTKGWEKERSQVLRWLNDVINGEKTEQVLEFSIGSFTYRLLNTGSCWVIAKFKTGNRRRLLDCRIRELRAVRVTDLSGKRLRITIEERAIQQIKVTPEMRARFARVASEES